MRRPPLALLLSAAICWAWALAGADESVKAPAHDTLSAKHFRLEVRTGLDAGEALLQELTVETPEPAKVSLIRQGSGSGSGPVWGTKKRSSDSLARARARILIDYLEGGEKRFKGGVVKFVLNYGDDALDKADLSYEEFPATKCLDEILKRPLKPGVYVYPYTGDESDDKALELLTVKNERFLLRVYDPRPKQ